MTLNVATTNADIANMQIDSEVKFLKIPTEDHLLTLTEKYDIYILKDCPKVREQLKRLRYKEPYTDIILYGKDEDLIEVCAAKPSGYLKEPFTLRDVACLIASISHGRTAYSYTYKKGTEYETIFLPDVNYIDIEARCIVFHCDRYSCRTNTLQQAFGKQLSSLLDFPDFTFLAPSIIINHTKIKHLNSTSVTFKNGDICYYPATNYHMLLDKIK